MRKKVSGILFSTSSYTRWGKGSANVAPGLESVVIMLMSQGHGEAQHAAPWESIVEEGFQATLAGSDNGKAFGSGVYFAKEAALSHKYALASASRRECPSSAKSSVKPLRMFLSRIVTGVYTGTLRARQAHTCSVLTFSVEQSGILQ
jgi:hypothetical protein